MKNAVLAGMALLGIALLVLAVLMLFEVIDWPENPVLVMLIGAGINRGIDALTRWLDER